MRKGIQLWLLVVALLGSGVPALADGMVLPQLAGDAGSYAAVRYHHVTVTIEDGQAVTRVRQEFYNPHDVVVDGRYVFPVPPTAVVSGFEVTLDGQRQAAERQDAVTTETDLRRSIVGQGDPSLLRYAGWESLAFDLSLAPGASRVMELAYEELLVPSGGLYRYLYVLSTERYSARPLDEVSITVDLASSSGLASFYAPNHVVQTERLGPGRARLQWQAQGVNPTDDFELFFAPVDGGFGGGLLTGERNGQGHLLFLFSPEVDPAPAGALPKDLVLVMDRSGSMAGEKIEQARSALHYILGQLGENDRFALVSFNHQVTRLSAGLLPVERSALAQAGDHVDSLTADGNTNLEAALQAGLDILARGERRDAPQMIIFLTDGLPTEGVTDDTDIARLVAASNGRIEARLHVFGVGYDVNTHLLDRLAADGGGSVTYVQPGENLEVALTGFYQKVAHPLLTDLEVEVQGLEVEDVYPETLPDLFQGSSLLLAGRYAEAKETVTVRVRGRAGDEQREWVYRFDPPATAGHDFVPRLWATRRVGALLDRVRVEGESRSLVDEIRDLGLGYGLVTPYTTFVVQGQATGAASAANMELYNRSDLNAVSGQTTIQARVQNQGYQQAEQANLALGANVQNLGRQSLAQVGTQQVDLSLLRGQEIDGPIDEAWIADNLAVDRSVEFGSEEYFRLAADPDARAFLQSGRNVVFSHQGQVIAVRDGQAAPDMPDMSRYPASATARPLASRLGWVVVAVAGSVALVLALGLGAAVTVLIRAGR